MNTYIECFKYGKLNKRYNLTQIDESGRNFLKSVMEIDGYETIKIESETELETGKL